MLSDDQEDDMNRIETELETLQCQSEDCVLIEDANDLMDAVQDQVDEMNATLPAPLRKHFDLSGKIDTIINNLQSVLDKDKE
jgi:hypothetical protein